MNGEILKPNQLKARASLAGEWYRDGRITRSECFRIEVDAPIGEDSGPIRWKNNSEYEELRQLNEQDDDSEID